jgi:2-dehydro-3-deoxyphosphogluconate aldolase/(4S)-4-hydroxy-2-oxoglutarate aldolase
MQPLTPANENNDAGTGMTTPLSDKLRANPIIPLIQADTTESAVAVALALRAGGMPMVEVVQRTDASLQCLEAIAHDVPDLVVGAGTVLSAKQATECMNAGAQFIVSPGLDKGVVDAARARQLAVIPGIMTPTELQQAFNIGLRLVKFFPASTAGGIKALAALASVFRDVQFIPTGGISASNLSDYLSSPAVLACGGSWMTPEDAIASADFARVTALAAEALVIARNARGN